MARSGPEQKFTAEMNKSFEEIDCAFYHRIEDDAFNAATTHTRKKPFDALAFTWDGKYTFEYKAERQTDRWNFKKLAPHQIEALANSRKHGACPIIIVNFRQLPKNKTRAFSFYLWKYIGWLEDGKKSITIEELEKETAVTEIRRIKLSEGSGWNVAQLVGGILNEKKFLPIN